MKFSVSRIGYFADFVTMPLALLVLPAVEMALHGPSAAFWLAVPVGLVLWTLFEYGLHRVVFHSDSTIGRGHDVHHARPAALIGLASAYTLAALCALYAAAVALCGWRIGGGLTLGFVAGYLGYIAIHYAIHHRRIEPASLLYAAKMRHIAHHRGGQGNYGVTVPWWDAVFRTRV